MVNNEMYLQSKLTLQKNNLRNLILLVFAIFILIVIMILSFPPCGLQHMFLIDDLKKYEQSFDPNLCYVLVEKIDSFNEQCHPTIEILDCG